MQVLLKSATIIDRASDHHKQKRDILISDGKIRKIEAVIKAPSTALIIDLPNLHVSRGWFDSSVSFGEPGFEHRETIDNGMAVAAASGMTNVAINPNTYPVTDTKAQVGFISQKTMQSPVNAQVVGAVTHGCKGVDLAEMYDMYNAGCRSFYDYKRPSDDLNLLKLALQYCQPFDALIQSFPMDIGLAPKGVMHEGIVSTLLGLKGIPTTAETLRIQRDLAVLEYTGGKLHFPTISSAAAVDLIKDAKARGLDVSCSVAAHHLILTETALETFDTQYKVLPPLRSKEDMLALISGVQNGIVDGITSDHNPLDIEAQKKEFDLAEYGTLGLESLFGAANKALGLEAAVEALTRLKSRFQIANPALEAGSLADLSLFDPTVAWKQSTANLDSYSKNSIFNGHELLGKPYGMILGDKYHLNS